jgi:hypothetical protein
LRWFLKKKLIKSNSNNTGNKEYKSRIIKTCPECNTALPKKIPPIKTSLGKWLFYLLGAASCLAAIIIMKDIDFKNDITFFATIILANAFFLIGKLRFKNGRIFKCEHCGWIKKT